MTADPTVIPAVLGWRNPDDDGLSVRLYARDRGPSPRWDQRSSPGGRTIECALVSRGIDESVAQEGDRYLVVRIGDRFVDEDRVEALTGAIEALLVEWGQA